MALTVSGTITCHFYRRFSQKDRERIRRDQATASDRRKRKRTTELLRRARRKYLRGAISRNAYLRHVFAVIWN